MSTSSVRNFEGQGSKESNKSEESKAAQQVRQIHGCRSLPPQGVVSYAVPTPEDVRASALRLPMTGHYMARPPLVSKQQRVEVLSVLAVGREKTPCRIWNQTCYRGEEPKRQRFVNQCMLKLIGLSGDISAWWRLAIPPNIDNGSEQSFEDEANIEEITVYVEDTNAEYNKLFVADVKSGYANLEVMYAVLGNATEAKIEVKLESVHFHLWTQRFGSISIQGKITAHSKLFDQEIVLFSNDKGDDNINIGCGQIIPLTRSVVVVPLIWPLCINFDLRTSSGLELMEVIDIDLLEFYPDCEGIHRKSCTGLNARIEVKISWQN